MNRLKTKIFYLLIGQLLAVSLWAQDFSNKGKEFWLTYPAHVDATSSVMGIYITSDKAATGQVKFGTTTIPFSIAANGVRRIFLGPNGDAPNTSVYLSQLEGIAANAGIHVTADQPVVVYAHIIRNARSGATLTLPTNVWGKEYIVPSYRSAGASGANSGFGIITVVAKEANTVVEIKATQPTRTGIAANTPITITLSQPGDVYQVQFPKDADISGSVVRSIATGGTACKPIAVYSATTWSAFDCAGASGGDNLFQQLFPTRAWGKNFITAPFIRKLYDIYRVFVLDPTTVVTRQENGVAASVGTLINGSYYEFKSSAPNLIKADKAISVVQYMTSETCDNNGTDRNSDPEMVVLSPLEQTINNITVFSAHVNFVPPGQSAVNQCFLNIIIKSNAASSFRINGALPSASFVPITGTAYSYMQVDISSISSTNPVQTLTADSSFSAIAYGYGLVESYGYNAGTAVKDQFQFITIKNEFATVNFPATCVNSPFNFAITLPYQSTKLQWQFYGRFPDTTVTNPTPDSSFVVEGRTLYQYRLPRTYILTATGSYKVTVIATNPSPDGCEGEQQIDYEVEVFPRPRTDFTWSHTGCVTDSVRFTDLSNGFGRPVNKWLWNFGDNTIDSVKNPVKKYAAPGNYTITQRVITDIGCVTDTTKVIQVTNPPVAKFAVSTPRCVGSTITFTDQSTSSVGANIVKWYWDFGNGRKDTLGTNQARTIAYAAAGTYTVSLIVETQSGCRSVAFTQPIVVTVFPVADFVLPAGVCLPSGQATFTNKSVISDGTQALLTFLWNFGDGQTSTVVNPTHFYKATGPFNIKVTVTSNAGCIKDTTQTLSNVFAQPKADFTVQPEVCLRDSSKLQATGTAVNQAISKYYWKWGDNTADSGKNIGKVYASPGSYTITHWMLSDKGCYSDTVTKTHIVNPLPVADFATAGFNCENSIITFTDRSVPGVGSLTRWQWNLGDGTVLDNSNVNSFTHQYTSAGNKNITLVVTSSKGCKSDTLKRVLKVNVLPVANFDLPEVCLTDASAVFNNTTAISDGTIGQLTYEWNFGDPNANAGNPNIAVSKNGVHRYSASGNYTVTLIAISPSGCRDTSIQVLTVNGDKPKADFNILNANGLCSNVAVSIQNTSSVNFGSVTKTEIYWEWPSAAIRTVDDDPVLNKVYNHQYAVFNSPATKTVQIRFLAYSGGVCVNEVIKNITLNATPKVLFGAIPGICLDAAPRLITQASDAAGLTGNGIYSGPGITAAGLFDPAKTGAGTFTLQYNYNSAVGCKDSATQTITVWPRPVANFSVDAPTCVNNAVTIRDASTTAVNNISQWKWNLGDGQTDNRNSGNAFTHVYNNTGSYKINLQVITDSGCTSLPVEKTISIHPLPVVDFAMPVVCMPSGRAQFTDNSTISDGTQGQFTYLWNFGVAGATSTQRNPVYNYPAVGSYTVKLIVTSNNGCKDSLSKQLTDVNPQPLANFSVAPPEVCLGAPMSFTDLSNPLGQTVTGRFWQYGDGQGSQSQNPTHTYRSAGQFTVSFYYTTSKGCQSDTVNKTAVVHPYPVVNAGPDQVVLEGGETTLRATATGSSNYQFLWTPSTWLNNANMLQPISRPQGDITYTLRVTGAGGCSATDDVFVKLLLAPEIPNAFSPNGDAINDTWVIKYLDSYPGATVQVFDRYGKRVFSSTGYQSPWDGKLNGAYVPVGVYYYVIEPKNGRKPYQGSVTIVR